MSAGLERGKVISWGRNNYHQLGRNSTEPFCFKPEVVALPGRPSQLAVGSEHNLALVGMYTCFRLQPLDMFFRIFSVWSCLSVLTLLLKCVKKNSTLCLCFHVETLLCNIFIGAGLLTSVACYVRLQMARCTVGAGMSMVCVALATTRTCPSHRR